jgi:hypothetical protein
MYVTLLRPANDYLKSGYHEYYYFEENTRM